MAKTGDNASGVNMNGGSAVNGGSAKSTSGDGPITAIDALLTGYPKFGQMPGFASKSVPK